ELVTYFTDHFFHYVFHGDNAAGSAEFINHNSEMYSSRLEVSQQVFDQPRFRYEIRLTHQGSPVETIAFRKMRNDVFRVDDACDVVERFAVNWQTGVVKFFDLPHQFAE